MNTVGEEAGYRHVAWQPLLGGLVTVLVGFILTEAWVIELVITVITMASVNVVMAI